MVRIHEYSPTSKRLKLLLKVADTIIASGCTLLKCEVNQRFPPTIMEFSLLYYIQLFLVVMCGQFTTLLKQSNLLMVKCIF